jgi:hypothetical protein
MQAYEPIAILLSNPNLIATFFAPTDPAIDALLKALGTNFSTVLANPSKFRGILEPVSDAQTERKDAV